MNDQAFSILEYDQLKALLRSGVQTPMGAARVDALAPIDDLTAVETALAETAECVQLRKRGVAWSFSDISDPAESIGRLRVEGAALDPIAILALGRLCEQAMSARASILAENEASPLLSEKIAPLSRELNSLIARISNKILPTGEIDDRASPELAQIRHDVTRLRSSLTRSLENLMRRSEAAIQDELVTIRNDRFVIPVKADHRGQIKGVAHGFSSSGATAFIEPLETIEANNELQTLREAEEREIHRILLGLSEELRSQLPAIEMAAEVVAELDFINAKAVFHQRFDCTIPEINAAGVFELIEARHPLLEENLRRSGGSVVPVSFSLDQNKNAMVISGANAGGKTVVLKTAGLLSLMALSGLPVPARAASVPFFHSVLADIGDHQSLAANLSTFTSHVANISRMLDICQSPALVLLDEVGTGTDPEEGSALGVAVVDHFRKACGAQVLATTHYSGLKMYAANEEGVINASVEFDEKTLKPTYKLLTGVAGSSSGLEIARRFGIPNVIVGSAAEKVKDSSRQATEFLRRIKREAEEAAQLRKALEEERAAVADKFASLDREAQKSERDRQTEFEDLLRRNIAAFEKHTRELLARIEERADRLKVEREAQKRIAQLKREVRIVRHGQIVSTEKASVEPEPVAATQVDFVPAQPREIVPGDRVRLRSFGSVGIVDTVKGDEAEVRVKSLRLREKVENLELVEEVAPPKPAGRFAKLKPSGSEIQVAVAKESSSVEINVIGQRAEEAVEAVDKFLDAAVMNSVGQVRVVHGHGTGALRRAVAELLTGHPHVERFSNAPPDQGGSGATVVELRQ
ncbi:MAG TPA: endonuclease MutS2 [Pyrinomonadaceae bacterium]|nr:endonuclease MutS2 [Pyrinomonadaceae bacterium]